jgi:predicted GH43/DUF377 family glycosyl hydrolase
VARTRWWSLPLLVVVVVASTTTTVSLLPNSGSNTEDEIVVAAAPLGPPHTAGWRYSVEVGRLNNGNNVFFDSRHRPDTTDFVHNFGPGYVKMLDGTDALVIRSCVNATGCSTADNPDVITMVKRSHEPLDIVNLQAQFQMNSAARIILRPEGAEEQCGVQDPRITVDYETGLYYLTYVAYGDQRVPPRHPRVCSDVKTKVAVSKSPEDARSWRRLNRTGDKGFDAKSTAMLIRDRPPHYQWTGHGGQIFSWQSADLLHWTRGEVAIAARPLGYDSVYVEAGAPPIRLRDGNYLFTYDTVINEGRGPWASTGIEQPGQPQCQSLFCEGWGAGWVILNGSNPRHVLQRGNEPLFVPVMPWEFGPHGGGPEWNWTQKAGIGSTNGLMPLGNDTFIAWGCASDSLVEAFFLRVSSWSTMERQPTLKAAAAHVAQTTRDCDQ